MLNTISGILYLKILRCSYVLNNYEFILCGNHLPINHDPMAIINTKSEYISGLTGLRGLAALAVFAVHYNQIVDFDLQAGPFDLYLFIANGEYGVALFFLLSGFLLALPFWQAILSAREWPNLKRYTFRRLARILPAYYLALTVLIIVDGLWRFPAGWTDIALHYSFLFNYTEFSIFSINAPFWTLAVEVQFYLCLPLLFILLRRLPARLIAVAFVLLGLVAYGGHYWLSESVSKVVAWPGSSALTWIRPHGAVVTHSLLAHLPLFLIGVVSSWLLLTLKERLGSATNTHHRKAEISFWLSLICILILLSTDAGDLIKTPYGRYGLPIVPLLFAAMIVSVSFTRIASRILEGKVFLSLGVISYGVYIFHLPCLKLIDRLMASYGWDASEHWLVLAATSFTLTLILAASSYLLVERPVLKAVHRYT